MAFSAARSAAVTGSKPPAVLVLDRQRGAEEGQDGVAGDGGELVDEGGEIDGRHAVVPTEAFRSPAMRMPACRYLEMQSSPASAEFRRI